MSDGIKELVKRLRRIQYGMANEEEDAVLAAIGTLEAMETQRDRLKAALVEVEDRLNCRGHPDVAHYCPNCDNSLHNARETARKALGGDA